MPLLCRCRLITPPYDYAIAIIADAADAIVFYIITSFSCYAFDATWPLMPLRHIVAGYADYAYFYCRRH